MALYIGANYHPHDWDSQRWQTDINLMKEAGFNTVRTGELCWDCFEPEEGVYTFEWFDEVMDLFAKAGIGVVLDVCTRPAPVWVHKLCPGANLGDSAGNLAPSVHRYMEDVSDPGFQYYAMRFAEVLVKRYKDHPALLAFGLCNEVGSGEPSFSAESRQRFIAWLKRKYKTVDALNDAWATHRWCRKLTSFDDVQLPKNSVAIGPPEAWLDMRRFFSDSCVEFLAKLRDTVESLAPGVPHASNHYCERSSQGFDYLNSYERFVDYPAIGFYPMYRVTERYYLMMNNFTQRLAETGKPMWCLEFLSGGEGMHHGPYGAVRMMAMLALLNRTQMVLGWTWRSMLGGEEQYLYGLLNHDGMPSVNYEEYREIAGIMHKLEPYAFPYLPTPDIAVGMSFDNERVVQYCPSNYHESCSLYHQQFAQVRAAVQKVFCDLNRDFNIANLKNIKHDYKLLILPNYVLMSEAEAKTVREFVASGGTVIMTAYSATVDEHNQVFGMAHPGRLADVFGIRVVGFERTSTAWRDLPERVKVTRDEKGERELVKVSCGGEELSLDVEYFEQLKLEGAAEYAAFTDWGIPAVTVNEYGKGKAYYVAVETNYDILKCLITHVTTEIGLKPALVTPEGVQARRIAENQVFYVNTTRYPVTVDIDCPAHAVLAETDCTNAVTIPAYSAELLVEA